MIDGFSVEIQQAQALEFGGLVSAPLSSLFAAGCERSCGSVGSWAGHLLFGQLDDFGREKLGG